MKIGVSKKLFLFLGIFVIGIGIGVGGMILKEHFFPGEDTKIVYVERKPDEIGPLIELKEFLVNLNGGGMVKTEITIEGVNAKSEEKIRAKEIFIRDRIISVLGSKKMADVLPTERDGLKNELVTQLNEICHDEVRDVLFTGFIYSP